MVVSIRNLEPIDKCDIVINKLTVIAGMNNTGKSVVMRAINTLFDQNLNFELIKRFMATDKDVLHIYNQILQERTITFSLTPYLVNCIAGNLLSYLKDNADNSKIFNAIYGLMDTMATPHEKFSAYKGFSEYYDEEELVRNFKLIALSIPDVSKITLEKEQNSDRIKSTIHFSYFTDTSRHIEKIDLLADFFSRLFIQLNIFSDSVYPFPAERSGLLLGNCDFIELNPMLSKYLQNLRRVDSTVVNKNIEILNIGNYLEKNILRGTMIHENGQLLFKDSITEATVSIRAVSSSVRELAGVIMYLKYQAKENDTIMIDEPELSLHPAAIIYFTRAVAMMLKAKIKVIMITHSDQLLRELNSLIILKHENVIQHYKELKKEQIFSEDINKITIDHNKVSMYAFSIDKKERKVVIEEVQKNENGFYEKLFDEVIENMNSTDDLLWKMRNNLGKYRLDKIGEREKIND